MPKAIPPPDDPQTDPGPPDSTPQHPTEDDISRLLTGIWRLSHSLKQDVNPVLEQEFGVDLRQTMILRSIRNGCHYPKLLSEHLAVPPALISRQLDPLLKLGLIERQIDEQDSRRTRLTLTPKGDDAMNHMVRLFRERTRERLGRTTATELQTALRLLEQLQNPTHAKDAS